MGLERVPDVLPLSILLPSVPNILSLIDTSAKKKKSHKAVNLVINLANEGSHSTVYKHVHD